MRCGNVSGSVFVLRRHQCGYGYARSISALMSSNGRYCGVESTRSRTIRFDMSEEGGEEGREEAEEADDDDQNMPKLVCYPPQRCPWRYSNNVATNFWYSC